MYSNQNYYSFVIHDTHFFYSFLKKNFIKYLPGSDESSSSSESESDDPDRKDDEFTKAFLMTGSKKDRGKSPVPRSATPTNADDKKRKQTASPRSGSPAMKKVKSEPDFKPISSGDGRPTTPIASGSQPTSNPTALSRYVMFCT